MYLSLNRDNNLDSFQKPLLDLVKISESINVNNVNQYIHTKYVTFWISFKSIYCIPCPGCANQAVQNY